MKFDDGSKNKDDREEDGESEDLRAVAAVECLHEKLLQIIVTLCSKMRRVIAKNRNQTVLLYSFLRELLRDTKCNLMELFKEDQQFGEEIAHEIKTKPRNEIDMLFVPQQQEEVNQVNPEVVEAEVRQEIASTSKIQKRKSVDRVNGTNAKRAKAGDETVINELSEEVGNVGLQKDSTSAKKKRSGKSISGQEKGEASGRRTTRSSNSGETDSELLQMPPPSTLPSRLSRRRPATPSAPPGAPPLFSSTPVLDSYVLLERMDISPVVETNERTTV